MMKQKGLKHLLLPAFLLVLALLIMIQRKHSHAQSGLARRGEPLRDALNSTRSPRPPESDATRAASHAAGQEAVSGLKAAAREDTGAIALGRTSPLDLAGRFVRGDAGVRGGASSGGLREGSSEKGGDDDRRKHKKEHPRRKHHRRHHVHPEPRAEEIAERLHVSREEIVELREAGFDWDEISEFHKRHGKVHERARDENWKTCALAKKLKVSSEEIAEMREGGLGWGQIMKSFRPHAERSIRRGEAAARSLAKGTARGRKHHPTAKHRREERQ